ncbi:MAG: hypothetical protein GY859_03085, partial [Desulfobacterales bacterium]|nr:hypothetical protein [Desulfobacterales bacterium]
VNHPENEKENVRFSLFTGRVDGKMWVDEIVIVKDSDRDGLSDTVEEDVPCLDALDPDTDKDGIPDGVEDADRNGVVGVNETDPCKSDSDGDGLSDGEEDANQNGVVDSGETDPALWDTDNDGYGDYDEIWAGFNPLNDASTPIIVCVEPSGYCDSCSEMYDCYSSLQDGIDAADAEAGDTTFIKVGEGAYHENVTVSGPVKLIIQDGPVILDGP